MSEELQQVLYDEMEWVSNIDECMWTILGGICGVSAR